MMDQSDAGSAGIFSRRVTRYTVVHSSGAANERCFSTWALDTFRWFTSLQTVCCTTPMHDLCCEHLTCESPTMGRLITLIASFGRNTSLWSAESKGVGKKAQACTCEADVVG
eukprot:1832439-Pyramimonas_sp.AAC.2